MVNPIGDTKKAENTSGYERQKSITDRKIQNSCPLDFMEPLYTDSYEGGVRETSQLMDSLLLDCPYCSNF